MAHKGIVRHSELVALLLVQLMQAGDGFMINLNDLLGMGIETLAVAVDLYAALGSVEQGDIQFLFELMNMLGERGLGDIHARGCLLKITGFHKLDEFFKHADFYSCLLKRTAARKNSLVHRIIN